LLLLLLDSGPLTCVSSTVFDIESSCVPVETLSITDGAQSFGELGITKEDFLCLGQLSVFVDWLLLSCDRFYLDELFESPSSNGTFSPFVKLFDFVRSFRDSNFATGVLGGHDSLARLLGSLFLAFWGFGSLPLQIKIFIFDTFGSAAREHSLFVFNLIII